MLELLGPAIASVAFMAGRAHYNIRKTRAQTVLNTTEPRNIFNAFLLNSWNAKTDVIYLIKVGIYNMSMIML